MKQQYNLGDKVFAFKQQGDGFVKACGVIVKAEINTGGYIQYEIKCQTKLPNGDLKDYTIYANHASMAGSETEIDAKIKKYKDWSDAQKIDYEQNFGVPEYNWESLNSTIGG